MRGSARQKALAEGKTTYFTGKPCPQGHVGPRYTNQHSCVECSSLNQKAWFKQPENRLSRRIDTRKRQGYPEPTRPMPPACECCGAVPTNKTGNDVLRLDHCHTTGEFRGWLCNHCNLAIGKLGDNEEGLVRALDYLRKAKP